MKVIKPKSEDQVSDGISIFLAGSIEMGTAEDWQNRVINHFEGSELTFFNPRRDDWDSSWEQKQSNVEFNHQVNWELNHLDEADFIFMYFSPDTKSPISLLELGRYADSNKMIVCCPEGFWRRGNVEIVCTREGVPFYHDFDEAVGALRTMIAKRGQDYLYS